MKNILLILLAFITVACNGQKITMVTGYIFDHENSPIPGASITQNGTLNGTSSNERGYFELNLDTLRSNELIVAFVGMESQIVKVKTKRPMTIVLQNSANTLDEVIVTGYGVRAKRALTGAVTRISKNKRPEKYNHPVQFSSVDYENENYEHRNEIGFVSTKTQPLTTFSADVDRASYSNIRRFINEGQLPPSDAVRIEEMINYFDYNYTSPTNKNQPISINTTLTNSPFNEGLELLRVSLQTERIATSNLPASNLVFLIDVSGSMGGEDKLPLLIKGFKLLVSQLRPQDRVSIITYAGYTRCALKSTSGKNKEKIITALDALYAGGGTAGASGIQLAYEQAQDHFIEGGNNRVILATDGDFNVGISSVNDLEKLIEEKRKTGIFLSVLGFGQGNLKDYQMETLADKGNGNFSYIDNLQEARKVFINEFGGTLFTIAKDVKIQIEFNPSNVQGYRLIGYENRRLNAEDFEDDEKDAGELGAGHSMTALYEIIPAGLQSNYLKTSPELKYQREAIKSSDYLTLKVRHKIPDESKSIKTEIPVKKELIPFEKADEDFRFAASVAEFGMILKESPYKGIANYDHIIVTSLGSRGNDEEGYRIEFVKMVRLAKALSQDSKTEN